MAANLGDLIRIVDVQVYLGQQMLNVYYYRVTSITGLTGTYLNDIANQFSTNVVQPVRAVQSTVCVHQSLESRNLSNNLDIASLPLNQGGNVAGAPGNELPSYIGLNFSLKRTSAVTRNGRKEIGGLTDTDVDGNTWIGGATRTGNIANGMASDIVLGLVTVAEPIIVKRPIVPPVATYVYSSIDQVAFNGLGSQNTRKPGSGI